MAIHRLRIGIVGASSLLGKELSEEIGKTALAAAELVLLDTSEAEGQLQTAGDELALVQKVDADALRGLDFAFFAGVPAQTREYWRVAHDAGATVIDLSGALAAEPGVVLWSPWLSAEGPKTDLQTTAVVPVHGVATMLALVGERLRHAGFAVRTFAATVMQPASQTGRAGMDELHQQTVSLLSFQSLPEEVFGTQVAFNVVAELGAGTAPDLSAGRGAIQAQYAGLSQGRLPSLAVQLVQAPVFHSYTVSLFLELESPARAETVEAALSGARVRVLPEAKQGMEAGEVPSNVTAAGQDDLLLRVTTEEGSAYAGTRFWIWMAADTLRMGTAAGVQCALELRALRPKGTVQ